MLYSISSLDYSSLCFIFLLKEVHAFPLAQITQSSTSGFSLTTQSDDQELLLATRYFCSWVAISLETCINGHYPYLEAENKPPYITILIPNSN